jgi:hypothetical protein
MKFKGLRDFPVLLSYKMSAVILYAHLFFSSLISTTRSLLGRQQISTISSCSLTRGSRKAKLTIEFPNLGASIYEEIQR